MSGARGRFFVAGIAVLALVFSLAGMSLLLARDALPGDALYGIKRASEAASLGLTFSDESKAIKHLDFAASRVNEIETLAQRYPDPSDAPLGGYLSALSDLDADAAAGSRQMIALATGNDGRLLESLRDWSSQQASRLTAVVPHLPQAARSREDVSLALLNKIAGRSQALLDRMQCFEITSGSVDDIGALPATGVCQKPADGSAPGPTGGTRPDSVTAVTDPTSPPRVTGTAPTGATVPPGPGTGAAAGGGQTAQTGSQTGTQTVPPGGTTTPPAGGAPPLVIPLPLLPPITVPSLLPGLPPIQLGG